MSGPQTAPQVTLGKGLPAVLIPLADSGPIGLRASRLIQIDPSGCWLWKSRPQGKGYGQIRIGARRPVAHRVVYELLMGPIPDGLTLDHLCRVRHCVNPDHLEPVTGRENTLRGNTLPAKWASRTHCNYGHEFTPENTYWRKGGGRECATCNRERMKALRSRRREVA